MLKLFKKFKSADKEVQRFILTIGVIGAILVATTFYSYFRLTS